MQILDGSAKILDFIHLVSSKKRELDKWQYLHVKIHPDEDEAQCDEVSQFLEFQIQCKKTTLLRPDDKRHLLVFSHKDNSLTFSKFEKAVYENFSSEMVTARIKGFDGDGLEVFADVLSPLLDPDNKIAHVSLKRLKRPVNTIFVVDDDEMVLKQMEKILAGYGNVISLQDTEHFHEQYKQHAPNVLFLDIHLGAVKGNELLRDLKGSLDPYAHVVMISSDTKKEMILDVKTGGANGFIVKPPNRNNIFQNLMKAPTIVTAAH